MRALLILLVLAGSAAAAVVEGVTEVKVVESITGTEGRGGDPVELGRIADLEKGRIAQANAELPRLPPTLARVAQQDLGAALAELSRVLVSSGKTEPIGMRVFRLSAGRIEVEDGARRIDIDLVAGTASVDSGSGAKRLRLLRIDKPLALADGKPGSPVLGRPTVAFTLVADNRDYRALVDPTLPNPFASMRLEDAEDDPAVLELGRLPGFPLLVEQAGEQVVRRWEATELGPK